MNMPLETKVFIGTLLTLALLLNQGCQFPDVTPPSITGLGGEYTIDNYYVQEDGMIIINVNYTVYDDRDTTITFSFSTDGTETLSGTIPSGTNVISPVPVFNTPVQEVTLSASDSSGNEASDTFTLYLNDNLPPTVRIYNVWPYPNELTP